MSTTMRSTRLIQQHQCTMDLSPKIPFLKKKEEEAQEEAGMGLLAQEGICRPALTFARASLELKSTALVFSLVEGDVHDLRLTSSLICVPPPEYCNKGEMLVNSFQFQTLADLG